MKKLALMNMLRSSDAEEVVIADPDGILHDISSVEPGSARVVLNTEYEEFENDDEGEEPPAEVGGTGDTSEGEAVEGIDDD